MAPSPDTRQAYQTKFALIGIFVSALVAFASYRPFRRRHQRSFGVSLPDMLMLVSATHRLGRMVAYDRVAEPIRAPFATTRRDESGAGETTVPRGRGAQHVFGELLTCPICAGTWIAAGLFYALHLLPGPTRIFLGIMSTIGAVEILDAVTEWWTWTGQAARRAAGQPAEHDVLASRPQWTRGGSHAPRGPQPHLPENGGRAIPEPVRTGLDRIARREL